MPKRYKVISGEYETIVNEDSFHTAAVLAIRLFDLKHDPRTKKKLGTAIMVTATHDGEWVVIDTQCILNEMGLKYERVLKEETEDAEDSDSEDDKPSRGNLTIFPR